jgi:peroxiredoxin
MRAVFLTIPAGLALACAGAALMIAARKPRVESVDIKEANVRHLVTEEMIRETATYTRKPAPTMTATDTEGKTITLGSRNAPRPQFVYFVLDGCPCSFDAEPLFHKLYKQFKGSVDFVSVTDADLKKAKEWSVQMLVNYPVVPDPEKRLIHAYGAKSSVYSTLLSADGHVIKMWPGYSAGLLKDMNSVMAKAANVPEKPFDPEYAPLEKATGCSFK